MDNCIDDFNIGDVVFFGKEEYKVVMFMNAIKCILKARQHYLVTDWNLLTKNQIT